MSPGSITTERAGGILHHLGDDGVGPRHRSGCGCSRSCTETNATTRGTHTDFMVETSAFPHRM